MVFRWVFWLSGKAQYQSVKRNSCGSGGAAIRRARESGASAISMLSRVSLLPQVVKLDVGLWSAYKLCGGGGVSGDIHVDWAGVFASKLAPTGFVLICSSCFCRVIGVLNILWQRVFKRPVGYFAQATTPCAIAYGYARIRRLVRLGSGLYRLPVAEKQRSGLVARLPGA
ncbi:hypothetical protein PS710_02849 [Pseudomonas fluorescens]|uniref:Uncharacterized protein n=1 Tax=Pseudomonas fluorescens TaxID=294 RepID=A0A5E7CEQ8_PSEFL|nr:hypothetical protein PS710_02849 [Pseudomonas fluorescens]